MLLYSFKLSKNKEIHPSNFILYQNFKSKEGFCLSTLREKNFAGRKFFGFRGFCQKPRNLKKSSIREIKLFWKINFQ